MTYKEFEREIKEAMKDSLDYEEGTYISVLYIPKKNTFMQRVDDGRVSYTDCITVASIEGKGLCWVDYLADDIVVEAKSLLDGGASWIDYPACIVKKAKKYAEDIDIEDMDSYEAEEIMKKSGAADFILQEYKKEWMESLDWKRAFERYVDDALEILNR